VKRCQLPNGEEYGCYGLATDETCLKTSIMSGRAGNCICWQACVYNSTELRTDTKKTKTPCEKKECWRSGRLRTSLRGVFDIDETEQLFFKDGDILGLLVDCTSQPVLQFFVNKRQMLETPLLESVFNKKLFPAFSGRHCEIEVVLNPDFPDLCKGGEDEDAADSQAELGAGGGR
jgi:hypothetical protein